MFLYVYRRTTSSNDDDDDENIKIFSAEHPFIMNAR